MATHFKLPEIGEGVTEGEIVKWLVEVGDVVEEDQPLVEVMTDKATVEVPSAVAGEVLSLDAEEGEIVPIGAVILTLSGDVEETALPEPDSRPVDSAIEEARAVARATRQEAEATVAATPGELDEIAAPVPVMTTPATRKLARELGIDLTGVTGTGRGGRIMKEDVLAASKASAPVVPAATDGGAGLPVDAVAAVAAAATAATLGAQPVPAKEAVPVTPATAEEPAATHVPAVTTRPTAPAPGDAVVAGDRIPFRGLRRKIAERMVLSKATIPHFAYVEEVDMTEIVRLRAEAKQIGAERGLKVTYLPFIVRALIPALKRHPIINSSLDEEAGEIVLKPRYNIGIATATDRGLMVPVVHDAERLDIFELAQEIGRLVAEARDGRSALADLQGGTFTITSTGNIGGILAIPVINHPEVAILGVTSIRERPVVRDGEIVVRHMMNLSLSLDHRVVDGADGALFMRDVVRYLEDPKLQLLGSL